MEFEELVTIRRTHASSRCSVSYKRTGTKHKTRPRLIIGISALIIGNIRLAPSYKLHIGIDGDHGAFRLIPDRNGDLRPKEVKGGLVFCCGHVPRFGQDAADKEFVDGRVIDNEIIEVDLPQWALK